MAGQGGEGVDGSLSPVFADQVDQALANLGIALAALDADFSHVFKLTLLIVDHSQEKLHTWVQSADKVWHGAMKPVCTLIPVPRLALDGMQVEIEATAAVNDAPPQSS
jgi:enamine deaminase RidA (YjgF/YER057c/UK114 family)